MRASITSEPSRFEAEVRALSTDGTGVVNHPAGKVFFAPGVWPGDVAVFDIESEGPRYGYARPVEWKKKSLDRVEAPCPHQGAGAGKCGGCPWMIGSYESQLKHKEHRVRHALARAGFEAERIVAPIWGSPSALGYRNRAQFKSDGARLGFVEEGTNSIAEIDDCLVLNEDVRARYRALRARLPNTEWRPTEGHKWIFLELDDAMAPGEEPVLNRRRPFRQGNTAQNERMRAWLAERVPKAAAADSALELFAGSGNLTGALHDAGFGRILAVEVASAAMAQLRAKGWPAVETFEADLSKVWALEKLAQRVPDARVLLLDPPRAGAAGVEKLASALKRLETILYVSCDTATFVRDVSALAKKGFRLEEVQPLDLFPQTSHVEVMGRLIR